MLEIRITQTESECQGTACGTINLLRAVMANGQLVLKCVKTMSVITNYYG